jgi:hypothetical protein
MACGETGPPLHGRAHRGRLPGVCDQPAGSGPLPRPAPSSGAKSDPSDAKLLANLVRTDRRSNRWSQATPRTPRRSGAGLWTLEPDQARNRQTNALREYYPAALEAFPELHNRDALAVVRPPPRWVPSPGYRFRRSVRPTRWAGRQRGLDNLAGEIAAALRTEQLAARVDRSHEPSSPAKSETDASATRSTMGLLRPVRQPGLPSLLRPATNTPPGTAATPPRAATPLDTLRPWDVQLGEDQLTGRAVRAPRQRSTGASRSGDVVVGQAGEWS